MRAKTGSCDTLFLETTQDANVGAAISRPQTTDASYGAGGASLSPTETPANNCGVYANFSPAALAIEPPTPDNMEIEQIKYKDNALYINKTKYITGITPEVWQYRIGGYQVLDKWFKSHKGETFTIEHFDHISNVAGLIAETIKIQSELELLK